MHNHIVKAITTAAAVSVSALAVALAVASANQRAAASHDQMLLAALSVVIVLAVHLLPALLKGRQRLIMWPVWSLCFCLASFGHASWFYRAGEDAAAARAAGSVAAVAVLKEREAITQALDTIKARPVATVAAQIARTTDQNRREALALELAEAKRAAGMRDRLISLSGNDVSRGEMQGNGRETAGNVGGTLRVTRSADDATMVAAVVAALVVEVLGALLWAAALRGDDDAQGAVQIVPTVMQQVVNFVTPIVQRPVQSSGGLVVDEVAELRSAIARGECRATVQSIRGYMGCKTDTAARLRRALEVTT